MTNKHQISIERLLALQMLQERGRHHLARVMLEMWTKEDTGNPPRAGGSPGEEELARVLCKEQP